VKCLPDCLNPLCALRSLLFHFFFAAAALCRASHQLTVSPKSFATDSMTPRPVLTRMRSPPDPCRFRGR